MKLLGIGLDNTDGHRRITQADEYILQGGSQDTHGMMQEHAAKFVEEAKKRGKTVAQLNHREIENIMEKILR